MDSLKEQASALEDGRAFVDLSTWRKILVSGRDAVSWLNDLVTAAMDTVAPQEWRRTLLLDRTGRVKADLQATLASEGVLLVQDPVQPGAADALLSPYTLSSDVELTDLTPDLGLFALPGRGSLPGDSPGFRPSVLGEGIDALAKGESIEQMRAMLRRELTEAAEEAAEVVRIRRGIPRFGVDFGEEALPSEAGLDQHIDRTKGCFLGQEAVAKVANLGHPPRVVVPFSVGVAPRPGDPVLADGREAGRVTAVAPDKDAFAILARITWDARDRPLRTAAGDPLIPR
jgi:tRNA-modifying protein YgfZ